MQLHNCLTQNELSFLQSQSNTGIVDSLTRLLQRYDQELKTVVIQGLPHDQYLQAQGKHALIKELLELFITEVT